MKTAPRINSFPVIRLIRILGTAAVCWMILAAGFVTINMDTFKFVPAAILFSAVVGITAFSVVPSGSKLAPGFLPGRHSRRYLLLLGIHFFLTVFPSIIWRYGYDEPYLIGLNAVCFAVSLVVLYTADSGEAIRRLLFLFAGLLGILSVLGILEYFGLALVSLNRHTFAVAVSCNNPNLYSGVLLVLLPAAYLSVFLVKGADARRRRALRALLAAVSLLGLANLVMTQSRAALIGHFLSLVILVVFLPRVAGIPERPRRILRISTLVCFGLAVLALIVFNGQFRDKVVRTFTEENSRFLAWKTALRIWTRSPLTVVFGNGIGSFKPLFYTFKPAGYRLGPHMTWWDAAHNEYLELLVDGGLVSLGAFLTLIGCTFRTAFRFLKRIRAKKVPSAESEKNIAADAAGSASADKRIGDDPVRAGTDLSFSASRFTGSGGLLMLYPLSVVTALLADGFFSTSLRTNYILALFYIVLTLIPVVADRAFSHNPDGLGGENGKNEPARTRDAAEQEAAVPVNHRHRHGLAAAVLPLLFLFLIPADFVFVRRLISENLLLRGSLSTALPAKEDLFRQAAAADPGSVTPHTMLAEVYLAAGQPASFAKEADQTERRIANFANVEFLRGIAELRKGNNREAARKFEGYLVLDRGDLQAEEALLYAYTILGDTGKAVAQWARILDIMERNQDVPIGTVFIDPEASGIRVEQEHRAVTMGGDQARMILAAAASPPESMEAFLFRIHYIAADIARQASLYDLAPFFYLKAVKAAGTPEGPDMAPRSLSGEDAGLYSSAVRYVVLYHLEKAEEARRRGDVDERLTHVSALLSMTRDDRIKGTAAEICRKKGEFKRAAVILRF